MVWLLPWTCASLHNLQGVRILDFNDMLYKASELHMHQRHTKSLKTHMFWGSRILEANVFMTPNFLSMSKCCNAFTCKGYNHWPNQPHGCRAQNLSWKDPPCRPCHCGRLACDLAPQFLAWSNTCIILSSSFLGWLKFVLCAITLGGVLLQVISLSPSRALTKFVAPSWIS